MTFIRLTLKTNEGYDDRHIVNMDNVLEIRPNPRGGCTLVAADRASSLTVEESWDYLTTQVQA